MVQSSLSTLTRPQNLVKISTLTHRKGDDDTASGALGSRASSRYPARAGLRERLLEETDQLRTFQAGQGRGREARAGVVS